LFSWNDLLVDYHQKSLPIGKSPFEYEIKLEM